MNIEKVFKREDGSKIKLGISLYSNLGSIDRNIYVYICEKNKRTFRDVHNSDDYSWRALNPEDRKAHILKTQLQYVTVEEINQLCRDLTEDIYAKISL